MKQDIYIETSINHELFETKIKMACKTRNEFL